MFWVACAQNWGQRQSEEHDGDEVCLGLVLMSSCNCRFMGVIAGEFTWSST